MKYCPKCEYKTKENFFLKKSTVIGVIILTFVLFILSAFVCYKRDENNDAKHKTVVKTNEIAVEKGLNLNELVSDTIKEEENLKEYLNEFHLTKTKEQYFANFLQKTDNFLKRYNDNTDREELSIWNESLKAGVTSVVEGIKIKPTKNKNDRNYNSDVYTFTNLEIVSPQIPILKFLEEGEGYFSAEIDYKYLNDAYSKYLGKSWQEYLKIKSKMNDDLGKYTYIADGYVTVEIQTLREWIILWESFIKKYNLFPLNEQIKNDLYKYTCHYLCSEVREEYNEKNNTYEPLSKTAIKDYELYLNTADSNSDIYKIIKQSYEILKKNNFELGDEHSDFCNAIYDKYDAHHH